MARLVLAACATAAASTFLVAIAAPATASSSGMAAEFPVGTCIDYQNDRLNYDTDDIIYVTAVPCTAPGRDYRVTAQVQHFTQCDPTTTNNMYITRDNVVLCVVQDHPLPT